MFEIDLSAAFKRRHLDSFSSIVYELSLLTKCFSPRMADTVKKPSSSTDGLILLCYQNHDPLIKFSFDPACLHHDFGEEPCN